MKVTEGRDRLASTTETTPEAPAVITVAPGHGPAEATQRRHFGFIDVFRGLAASVIAAHHILIYGPMSDPGETLLPGLIAALRSQGRYAVQVFFVVSAFVTAYSLGHAVIGSAGFARFALRRYLRLGLPYLAIVVGVLVLENFTPASFAAFPLAEPDGWKHVLAQAVFLQDILGYGNVSAGLWYVSIDFQFGILYYLLLWLHARLTRVPKLSTPRRGLSILLLLFVPLAVSSVFFWNTDPAHDVAVHYYIGSLFIGVLVSWSLTGRVPRWTVWLYAGSVVLGLAFQWRERLAVALTAGLLIDWLARRGVELRWWVWYPFRALGRISYSFFLVHYPTHWVVSGLYERVANQSPAASLLWCSVSFLTSLLVAILFYYTVERPSLQLAALFR